MVIRSRALMSPHAAVAAGVVAFAIVGSMLLSSGSMARAVLILGLAASPFLFYAAWVKPLVFPFGLYVLLIPFDNLLGTGPFGTLTKLIGIAAGAVLFLAATRRRDAMRLGRPTTYLFVLFAWMLLSCLWALDQRAALEILPTYAAQMLLFCALAMTPITPAGLRTLFALTMLGGIAAAGYGANAFYHDPTLSAAATDPSNARLILRSGLATIDPNHFANSLLLPASLVLMWGLRTRTGLVKLIALFAMATLVTGILLSGSREALVGLALILLYLLFRSPYRVQIGLVTGLFIVLSSSLQSSMWLRFAQLVSDGGSGRTSIWSVGFEAAKHRLLQGYGIGNFPQAYDIFYLGVHQTQPYGWGSPAHNLVLHYVVELGIVGFMLIAGFLWSEFRALRKIDKTNPLYDYRTTLEAALVALVAVSLTVDLFTYKYAWLAFSLIALIRNASVSVPRAQTQASAVILPASSAMEPARSARC